MKKILIIGGWGFIATNLIAKLSENSIATKVTIFDHKEIHPIGIHSPIINKVYAGDMRDSQLITRVFDENDFDIVFHFASATVPATSSNIRYDIEANLIPTISILDEMVKHKIKKIVFASSGGAIYAPSDTRRDENSEVSPISSYGTVKVSIEKYLQMYAHQYKIQPLILRISNPFGPYHINPKQGFINIAIRNALCKRSMEIWGDGNNRKDYIHIDDCITYILDLLGTNAWGQIINIGSGTEHSLNEILNCIKLSIPTFKWNYSHLRNFDTATYALNTEKLHSLSPKHACKDIYTGISETIEWHINHPQFIHAK